VNSKNQEAPHYAISSCHLVIVRPKYLPCTYSFISSVCFPLNIRDIQDEAAHPYNRSSKIIVLYILIFIFVNNKWEDNTFWTMLMTYFSKGASFWITDVI